MINMQKLLVYTDGGARGNPGPAAIGVAVFRENQTTEKIHSFGKTIGYATNNVAEYQAVVEALKWLLQNRNQFSEKVAINFFLDSNLVVNQLKGNFKIKNANLINLFYTVKELEKQLLAVIDYKLIPREDNLTADFLVNQALDNQ